MLTMTFFFANFARYQFFNWKNEKIISTLVFSSMHAVCFVVVQLLWVWNP